MTLNPDPYVTVHPVRILHVRGLFMSSNASCEPTNMSTCPRPFYCPRSFWVPECVTGVRGETRPGAHFPCDHCPNTLHTEEVAASKPVSTLEHVFACCLLNRSNSLADMMWPFHVFC